jgi:hypothetical protein
MKRRTWKVWVAGIALAQVLVLGVDMALLWPCEAEMAAVRLEVGTPMEQTMKVVHAREGPYSRMIFSEPGEAVIIGPAHWIFDDSSNLFVTFDSENRVVSVHPEPPSPIHPLTRLRRTLGRILPFLAEE